MIVLDPVHVTFLFNYELNSFGQLESPLTLFYPFHRIPWETPVWGLRNFIHMVNTFGPDQVKGRVKSKMHF